MNPMTGEILNNVEMKEIMEKGLIEISEEDLTDKQKEVKQVSKYDNRSKLGKLFTECRNKGFSGLTKNQKRNIKKKTGIR